MAGNMNTLMCIHIEVGIIADYDYVVTRGFEIVDIIGHGNVTTGAAVTQPESNIAGAGFVDLTTATMATDTINDIEYTITILDAQNTLTTGDTLRMAGEGGGVAGQADIYTYVIPTTWIAG